MRYTMNHLHIDWTQEEAGGKTANGGHVAGADGLQLREEDP